MILRVVENCNVRVCVKVFVRFAAVSENFLRIYGVCDYAGIIKSFRFPSVSYWIQHHHLDQ